MKKTIKITILLFLLLAVAEVNAQQNAVFTHYTVNPYLYNAAQVGENGYTTLGAHYRKQWANMPEAPDTKLFSAQTMIKDKFGVGAKVYLDRAHIVNNFGALFSYAYYIRFDKANPYKHYLSIGVSAGFKSQRLSFEESTIKDDYDPSIFYDGASNTVFDAEAGIKYKWRGLNIGVFASNLAPHNFQYKNDVSNLQFKPSYHVYGSLGYDIFLDKKQNFALKPSMLARYIPNAPVQFDANLLFDWKKTLWIGGGYRYDNAGVWGIAGFRIHDMIALTYSYEQSIDGYQAALGSSHEISLEFRFKKKIKDFDSLAKKLNRKIGAVRSDLVAKNQELIDSLKQAKSNIEDLNTDVEDLNDKIDDLKMTTTDVSNDNSSNSGSKVVYNALGRVNFDLNSATLHSAQKLEAEAIYDKIKEKTDNVIQIIIEGNASIEGSETYNLILSNKRTLSMKNFLIAKGINPDLVLISSNGNSEALIRDNNYKSKDSVTPDPSDRFVKVSILVNK
ncbi:MAG: PorP/SprF family type IX secretion system membrane protein [Chitinophagales bacterium]